MTTEERRHRWVPTEPVPDGWQRGNQTFVGDVLEVFFYDPAVPYSKRKEDGSTPKNTDPCPFDGGKHERYWSVAHEVYICNKCGAESSLPTASEPPSDVSALRPCTPSPVPPTGPCPPTSPVSGPVNNTKGDSHD